LSDTDFAMIELAIQNMPKPALPVKRNVPFNPVGKENLSATSRPPIKQLNQVPASAVPKRSSALAPLQNVNSHTALSHPPIDTSGRLPLVHKQADSTSIGVKVKPQLSANCNHVSSSAKLNSAIPSSRFPPPTSNLAEAPKPIPREVSADWQRSQTSNLAEVPKPIPREVSADWQRSQGVQATPSWTVQQSLQQNSISNAVVQRDTKSTTQSVLVDSDFLSDEATAFLDAFEATLEKEMKNKQTVRSRSLPLAQSAQPETSSNVLHRNRIPCHRLFITQIEDYRTVNGSIRLYCTFNQTKPIALLQTALAVVDVYQDW